MAARRRLAMILAGTLACASACTSPSPEASPAAFERKAAIALSPAQ